MSVRGKRRGSSLRCSPSKRQKVRQEEEVVETVQDSSITQHHSAIVGRGRKLRLSTRRIDIDISPSKKPAESVKDSDVAKSKPDDPPEEIPLYQESESDSKSSPTQCESPEHHPITVDIDIDIDMKPSDGDRTPELFSSGSLRQEGEERTIKTEEEPQKEAQIASKRLTGAKKRKSQPAKKLETDAYDKHPVPASCEIMDEDSTDVQQSKVTTQDKVVPLVSTSKVYHATHGIPDLVKSLGDRAVRAYECNWMCCPPGVNPKDYAKVIELMLDDYRLQLKEVQQKMLTMPAKWGKEIEEGDTDSRTLDKKTSPSPSRVPLINERLRMRHTVTSTAGTTQSTSTGSILSAGLGTSIGNLRNTSLINRYADSGSSRQSSGVTAASSKESHEHNLTVGVHRMHVGEPNIQQRFLPSRQNSSDASRPHSVQSGIPTWIKRKSYSPRREAKPVSPAIDMTVSKRQETEFDSSDNDGDDDNDEDFAVPNRKARMKKLGGLPSGTGTSQVVREGSSVGRQETERGTKVGDLKKRQLRPGGPQLKRVKRLTVSGDEEESITETTVDGSSSSGWMTTRTDKVETSHQRTTGTTTQEQGQCPICNKVFAVGLLERHAASCGEEREHVEEKSVWPMLQQDVIEVNDKETPKKKKSLRPQRKGDIGLHLDRSTDGWFGSPVRGGGVTGRRHGLS